MLLRLVLRGSRLWERIFFVASLGASGAAYRCALRTRCLASGRLLRCALPRAEQPRATRAKPR